MNDPIKPMGWLIPIISEDPFIWGEGACALSASQFQQLIGLTKSIHPRFLMSLKWRALFAESDDFCGSDDEQMDRWLANCLSNGYPIDWSSNETTGALSHCALAFFDARLSLAETNQLVDAMQETIDDNSFFQQLLIWRKNGIDAFLLKREDGHAF